MAGSSLCEEPANQVCWASMTFVFRARSLFGLLAQCHGVLRFLRFLFCLLLLGLLRLLRIRLIYRRSAANAVCHINCSL